MLNTARYVLVTALCVLALACGSKEENKPQEAPTSAEPAKKQLAPPTNKAAQPAGGLAADTTSAVPVAVPAGEPSGLVPELQKLADKACACKDKACANGVQDEVAKLMAEAKQPPASETQTIANTMQKLQGCVAQAQQK